MADPGTEKKRRRIRFFFFFFFLVFVVFVVFVFFCISLPGRSNNNNKTRRPSKTKGDRKLAALLVFFRRLAPFYFSRFAPQDASFFCLGFFFGGFSFFLPRRRPKSIRRVLVLTNAFARLSELPFFFVQTQFETSTTNQRPVLSLDSWSTSAFSFIIHQKKRCSFSRNGHHDSPSGREERNDSRGLLSLADLCRKNLFGELSPVGVVVLFLREGGGCVGDAVGDLFPPATPSLKLDDIHTHTHRPYTHSWTHTHTHRPYTHTHGPTQTHTHTHTHRPYTHTHGPTHTYTHTHRPYTHTHGPTHTLTHTHQDGVAPAAPNGSRRHRTNET